MDIQLAGFHSVAAPAFGTTIRISLFHPERPLAERAAADALRAARQVDRVMNTRCKSSQVFQLNRDGVLARPDPHLLAVLAQAHALSLLTRGAFDATVQPLWQVYWQARQANGRPLQSDRLKASVKVGWERVQFDAERVAFLRPGMQLTLNGLARGYAADCALAALRAHGIRDALVDTGEFASEGGQAGKRPWTVGVADPRNPGALAATMRLDGRSAATSGDYASAFTPDFVHHHIFDPGTGDSPQELAGVTVLAPTGMLADGLSTAFMVMGARKAHALAATLPGVDLMTINKRGVVWKSPGFPCA
ncbi:MAG: FAD:protein FMN transferase [Pseudomonadota bacterium]